MHHVENEDAVLYEQQRICDLGKHLVAGQQFNWHHLS